MKSLFGLAVMGAAIYLLTQESPTFNALVEDVRSSDIVTSVGGRIDQALSTDESAVMNTDAQSLKQKLANLRAETDSLRIELEQVKAAIQPSAAVRVGSVRAQAPRVISESSIDDAATGLPVDERRRQLRELAQQMELTSLGL